MTRDELKQTREEHKRVAESQENSESRMFLVAYMNALDSLRQLCEWRMDRQNDVLNNATFPVLHGFVVQSRVMGSLESIAKELEPEIRRLHPTIGNVAENGSRIWQMERLLGVYLGLRGVLESHESRSGNVEVFREASNMISLQLNDLSNARTSFSHEYLESINAILTTAPDIRNHGGGIWDDFNGREGRATFFQSLRGTNRRILDVVTRLCRE